MILDELPSLLEERAFGTWQRLLEGATTRIPPHEDGLTADHLSALINHLPRGSLWVDRYAGPGEGGAGNPNVDFEWWIEADGDILGLRFQAKLIDVASGRFRDLESKKAAAQALRCVENRYRTAAKYKARDPYPAYRYPLYCLYTATEGVLPVRCPEWRRSYGCSLVAAPTVLSLVRTGAVTLDDLGPDLMPWAWIFTAADINALERNIQAAIFGVSDADGDDASVVAALHDDESDIDDEASILESRNGAARLEAASDPARVVPPDGIARMEFDDAPGYVQRLALKAGLDLPFEALEQEEQPTPGTDHVALISRSAARQAS